MTKKSATPSGGRRQGAGRKPLVQGHKTATWHVRLTPVQRAVLEAMGGAKWLREQLDGTSVRKSTKESHGPD